jgi:rubrerythrin
MSDNKTIDILKRAILLEHRGKALYESVSSESSTDAVKELFSVLAEEEKTHIDVLTKQLKAVAGGGGFDPDITLPSEEPVKSGVLSEDIVNEISGAGYEAAVISAALEFEKKAVDYYSKQAESAESEEERKLFLWLTGWEKEHMAMLAKIDKEVMEDIWYDNSFWPLD